MKQYLPIGLVLLLLVLGGTSYQQDKPQATFDATPQVPWETAETITANLTALGVTARDFSAVWTDLPDANTAKYEVPNYATRAEIRFQTTTNADAHVVNLYLCAAPTMADGTEDSFALGAVLTLTGGTQTGPNSNVFVDTISVSEAIMTGTETVDSGNDRMALVRADLRGWKYIVAIATTLETGKTLYLDIRWF